jgi:hypothetical protein
MSWIRRNTGLLIAMVVVAIASSIVTAAAATQVGLGDLTPSAKDATVGAGPLTYVGHQVDTNEGSETPAKATCPKTMHVLGGGATTTAHFADIESLRSSAPVDGPDADNVPDDAWKVISDSRDSAGAENLHIRAFAICAKSRVIQSQG